VLPALTLSEESRLTHLMDHYWWVAVATFVRDPSLKAGAWRWIQGRAHIWSNSAG